MITDEDVCEIEQEYPYENRNRRNYFPYEEMTV
jgi:hypothetical protein